MTEASVGKRCGRPLSAADLETMRRAIGDAVPLAADFRAALGVV